ncbi:MAG: hypothetical protein K0R44_3439 [Thermomicrobiales bacterium]|nr:hypothetical protein [Thermomicrobiales bacterium]
MVSSDQAPRTDLWDLPRDTAEFLGLGLAILLIFKTDLRNLQLVWQEVIAVALAIAFPLALFPFSRTVWIAMDLIFHPPVGASERQLRGRLTERNDDYSE